MKKTRKEEPFLGVGGKMKATGVCIKIESCVTAAVNGVITVQV